MSIVFAASEYATAHKGPGTSVENGANGEFPAMSLASAGATPKAVFERNAVAPSRPGFSAGITAPDYTV